MTMFDKTMHMLRNRPRTLTFDTIAAGANVSREWLGKLSQNKMADPSVHKVQRLHDYLLAQLA